MSRRSTATLETKAEARRMYEADRLSLFKLALHFEVSEETIRSWIVAAGGTIRAAVGGHAGRRKKP